MWVGGQGAGRVAVAFEKRPSCRCDQGELSSRESTAPSDVFAQFDRAHVETAGVPRNRMLRMKEGGWFFAKDVERPVRRVHASDRSEACCGVGDETLVQQSHRWATRESPQNDLDAE